MRQRAIPRLGAMGSLPRRQQEQPSWNGDDVAVLQVVLNGRQTRTRETLTPSRRGRVRRPVDPRGPKCPGRRARLDETDRIELRSCPPVVADRALGRIRWGAAQDG